MLLFISLTPQKLKVAFSSAMVQTVRPMLTIYSIHITIIAHVTHLRYRTCSRWLPFRRWQTFTRFITPSMARAHTAAGTDRTARLIAVLTLARKSCFATLAGVEGGGGCDLPWRFQTKRRRASRKRPADCPRRVLAIGGIIFGPRSIFDPVMAGRRTNFRKFHDFLTSRVDSVKTIYRSGMKPSPALFPVQFSIKCGVLMHLG